MELSFSEDVISDKSSDTSVVLSILADAPWKLHGHLPDHSAEVLGDNLGGGHVVRDPDVFGPGLDREKSGNSPENHDRGDAADSLGSLETVSPLHSFSGRHSTLVAHHLFVLIYRSHQWLTARTFTADSQSSAMHQVFTVIDIDRVADLPRYTLHVQSVK